jgi:hypothetical protein
LPKTGLKLFPLFTILGWTLIGFSVLVGVAILSPTAADNWGEASAALAQDQAIIELAIVWLPYFELLGLGITLGAIVMALGSIAVELRDLGKTVMSKWPADQGTRKTTLTGLGWFGQAY